MTSVPPAIKCVLIGSQAGTRAGPSMMRKRKTQYAESEARVFHDSIENVGIRLETRVGADQAVVGCWVGEVDMVVREVDVGPRV